MRKTPLVAILLLLVISLPICAASEMNLVWDLNGNLVSGDGKYRIYNGLNQLTHIFNGSNSSAPLLETYKYHPVEERIWVKKVFNVSDSAHILETVIYVNENSVRVINSSGTFDFTYVLHAGGMIAQNVSGVTHFIHSDPGGGTSQVVTNSTGGVVEETFYSPYGEILEGGDVSRFDYRNKEYDSLVGDYDFHFRKMKPEWGIFLQPDTLLPSPYDPQQLNRYSYARNNPYRYVDQDGHQISQADADDSNLPQIIFGLYVADKERRAQTLFQELHAKYDSSTALEINVAGANKPLSFKELQEIELQNEFEVEFDETGEISGYNYKGEIVGGVGVMVDRGFTGKYVKNEIQRQTTATFGSTNNGGVIGTIKSIVNKVLGKTSGAGGYSSDAGGFVSSDGKYYPTKNKNWKPCGCATNTKTSSTSSTSKSSKK